jgi:hypothetical protein
MGPSCPGHQGLLGYAMDFGTPIDPGKIPALGRFPSQTYLPKVPGLNQIFSF